LLPLWDLQDKKECRSIQRDLKESQAFIVRNVKGYFNIERMGGTTTIEMVGNMCQDVFFLYYLGYKDMDGNTIRVGTANDKINRDKFAMVYHHYTPVPKGWEIPAENRPYIPPKNLALFEAGIAWVRKNVGERDAL
jgi:hypothetical protein